jgi:hypothetical protein
MNDRPKRPTASLTSPDLAPRTQLRLHLIALGAGDALRRSDPGTCREPCTPPRTPSHSPVTFVPALERQRHLRPPVRRIAYGREIAQGHRDRILVVCSETSRRRYRQSQRADIVQVVNVEVRRRQIGRIRLLFPPGPELRPGPSCQSRLYLSPAHSSALISYREK